jgi:formate/nitrite transporter
MSEIRIDALIPQEMASRAEIVGVRKAEMPFLKTFMLAILAGAFIAMGAIFATTVSAGAQAVTAPDGGAAYTVGLPYGIVRLLAGLVFSLGLILVLVGGAELFTGNNLIVMAWASGKISVWELTRNWLIVYLGNFVGAISTAALMFLTKQYTFGSGSVGVAALKTAVAKCDLTFIQAVALGILCNALVCMAVWLTFSARTTVDRVLAIIFPIAAFVAAGFEHSIANMYFIPIGLFIKGFDPAFVDSVGKQVTDLDKLTSSNFLIGNLLPVTIGNIIGGTVLVAAFYWMIYLRPAALGAPKEQK